MAGAEPLAKKPLLLFAVHALVLALLIGYWPSARAVYPELFRGVVEPLLGAGDAHLALRPATGDHYELEEKDTFVEAFASEGAEEPLWRATISALRFGYWPSAVLVALLLATPMTLRRRWWVALAGVLGLHLFALGRLLVVVAQAVSEQARLGAPADAAEPLVDYGSIAGILNSNIVVIAVVFLAWVALSQPRQGLEAGGIERLLGGRRPRVP